MTTAHSQEVIFVGSEDRTTIASKPAVRIRICDEGDAAKIAQLHCENVSRALGVPLLEAYYRACLTSQNSFCLCAEMDGTITGYVGVISERAELLKIALRRESMAVVACILQRPATLLELIRHAWTWMRFSTTIQSKICLPRWEYRPVVVGRPYRGRHIAQLLLAAAGDVLRSKGVKQVHLSVSPENVSAMRAYEHYGFQRIEPARRSTIPMLKNLGPAEPQ